MATVIPDPLRIVCTQCPAVAKVHLQSRDFHVDGVLIWAECHGDHRLGVVHGETLMARIHGGRDFTFEDVHAFEPGELENRLPEIEDRMQRDGRLYDAITRFLKGALV